MLRKANKAAGAAGISEKKTWSTAVPFYKSTVHLNWQLSMQFQFPQLSKEATQSTHTHTHTQNPTNHPDTNGKCREKKNKDQRPVMVCKERLAESRAQEREKWRKERFVKAWVGKKEECRMGPQTAFIRIALGHSTYWSCKKFQINGTSPFSNHTHFRILWELTDSRREEGNSGMICTSVGLMGFVNTRHSGKPSSHQLPAPCKAPHETGWNDMCSSSVVCSSPHGEFWSDQAWWCMQPPFPPSKKLEGERVTFTCLPTKQSLQSHSVSYTNVYLES